MTKIATVAFEGTYDVELSTKNHIRSDRGGGGGRCQAGRLPEISLQGYPPDLTRVYPERIKAAYDNAEAFLTDHTCCYRGAGQGTRRLCDLRAQRVGTSPGVIYNTMVLTGPDGHVGSYRKVHVGITEQLTWRRGNDWPVFDTRHRPHRDVDLLRQDVARVDP